MRERLYLSPPHMGGKEFEFVSEAFNTNWVAPVGPHLDNFEKRLGSYNNIENCVALSSGTAAIHLALIVLGIKPGDSVICSTFTFSGSCNPIVYQGAKPVFVDSETETWNMDPLLLEQAIKGEIRKGMKPKAIILVHLYGMPAKIDAILKLAREYDIPVIEDAAEALGSSLNERKLGTFGNIGIYSFNGNKIITTSGGGAMVSSDPVFIRKARFLSTQARDNAPHYQHSQIGFNYRLSNICAAIGMGQMEVLNDRIKRKREIFDHYRTSKLRHFGLSFLNEPKGNFSNRWLTCVTIDNKAIDRESLRLALEAYNIESRPLWKPMHLQPVFKDVVSYVNGVSESLFNDGLCLPSGTNMTASDLDEVIEIIAKTVEH